MLGSQAVTPYETMRASGLRPNSLTAASEAMTLDAAPSQMPEALPAETVPSFLKTEGSLARVSIVVLPRGCSSTAKVSVAFQKRIHDHQQLGS